jgi:hypothetical protein
MRTNKETLLKITKHTVEERTGGRRGILTACLVGSLLEENFLLGGATDIDLFFVHVDDDFPAREIVPITEDIHLDIWHFSQKAFENTRQLRLDPWLGYAVKDAKILYDTQHFMDFTQASVRGQFDRPEYTFERSKIFLEKARDIWMKLQISNANSKPDHIHEYMQAIENAANAIALLSGRPLTIRRFLYDFSDRAKEVEKAGLFAGIIGLIGGVAIDINTVEKWTSQWEAAYDALPEELANMEIHPKRKQYFKGGINALMNTAEPESALWALLKTWTMIAMDSPLDSQTYVEWKEAFSMLGMNGQAFRDRILGLDAFLDLIEETIEDWAKENGAWIE